MPGKYGENIAIDKNVTIRATSTSSESVTVDGGGLGSVFVVSGATVSLQGFVIQNGSATNGGVRNSGGTLTLTNTVIQTNAASGDGGGIWSDGPLTLNGATISNNVSTGEGVAASSSKATSPLLVDPSRATRRQAPASAAASVLLRRPRTR